MTGGKGLAMKAKVMGITAFLGSVLALVIASGAGSSWA
jgi:hypothetical protein